MENNTEEIVVQLYALRAGLSVISQYNSKLEDYESDIENEQDRTISMKNDLNKAQKEYKNEIDKRQELKNNVEAIEDDKEKYINNEIKSILSEKYHSSGKFSFYCIGAQTYFLIASFIGLIVGIGMLGASGGSSYMLAGGGVFFGIGSLFLVAVMLVQYVRLKNIKSSVVTETDVNLSKYKNDISNSDNVIAAMQKHIADLETLIADTESEIENNVNGIVLNIKDIIESVGVCGAALERQYKSILNPADWKNTDLCIFYLQTGRAETIKECLLLADRQRQNDEIVGAVKQASERISSDIRSGFNMLGSTLVSCFNALSCQLDGLTNMLSTQHDEMIRAMDKSNSELLSATQLSNALLEKVNYTSEQLVRDYKYVQSCHDIYV